MKICLISYDFWNYDQHIVEILQKKGIEAYHINIGKYKHANFSARLKNTFSKIFLRKNIKNVKRQELILDTLEKIGHQDQILVVNPEVIERKYHLKIKKFTNKYLAYLYDSTMRNPVGHIIDVFDKVYSFDKKDIKKYGFSATTNYNYLLKKNVNDQENKLDLFYIGSYDERLKVLYKLSEKLDDFKLKYQFVIVGKKSRKKALFNSSKLHSKFYFTTKRIPHAEIPNYYEKSRVILDLVREHQSGLSFRIFEAMALQKKIITTNPFVKEYDFYNSNNILLLNKDLSNLEKSFFETDYQELSSEIYQKYTLENWVKNIFDL